MVVEPPMNHRHVALVRALVEIDASRMIRSTPCSWSHP